MTRGRFFEPPLRVVIPPRPRNPALLSKRILEILNSGDYKFGNRWTSELSERLTDLLDLGPEHELILTVSGTSALRLAAVTLHRNGAHMGNQLTAVLPSFTFPATGEFLRQLGYELIFCDVDDATWDMSPEALKLILQTYSVDLVVCVDALGNPADYSALTRLCRDAGVPLLADSAAALGACHKGKPIATQANAHAFSMSMAKVISAAGAGGFTVLPTGSRKMLERDENWIRSSLMTETNAVVALDQLDFLHDVLARRAAVSHVYQQVALSMSGFATQAVLPGNTHSWVHSVIRCTSPPGRDEIASRLARLGIETKPYYAPPLHTFLRNRAEVETLPVTLSLAREVLALPVSSEMTRQDGERVAEALRMVIGDRPAEEKDGRC
jgi:dTDP-4-amino-4,6-dideoxygalactose transaminase